ncbi:triose-phosphate transporter family-domain-containing protein [Suillus discolor]|uniref:Triose-phosphate transporter family-domain-containing protein n=1 Tax=Suillus discolor TaxID=1912936 RepID=A0A9P7FEP0_9AGAM|nr:triose-phosphate transporter family-domain-containing protein [Suillus discolor]KAG2113810.1 triose-phosphate transporter family-domain-containing protein [Suillus discolor]
MAHHAENDSEGRHSYIPVESSFRESDHGESSFHIASLAEKQRIWWRTAIINTCFIASWYIFATLLSLYNKWMFSPDLFGFPYPLFVTTLHMIIQFVLAAALRVCFSHHFRPERSPSVKDYSKKAVPTAVATGLDIGLSNLSLKTITLSFYTMCKSSSLIFVLSFAFFFRLEVFSLRLVAVILLIFGGVILMVASETAFVLPGFLLVMTASACGGLRWSLTQLLLKNKNMGLDNPAATIFWLAPTIGATTALLSAIWEGWFTIYASPFFQDMASTVRSGLFLVAPGILAFCMVMSEYYIIQRAGVLPMSIAGIAKEVSTITISAWFFGDTLTPLNITGVGITVCGIALFTFHKYRNSIDGRLSVDAQGNMVAINDEDVGDSSDSVHGINFELSAANLGHREDGHFAHQGPVDSDAHQRLLFSTDHDDSDDYHEGEEDAELVRSIQFSKFNWEAERGIDEN